MANPDRPSGFKFAKTKGGAATAQVRAIGVADGANIYRGDSLTLSTGLAAVSATNDTAFLGVAVGFGKRDPSTGSIGSMTDPDNLEIGFYNDAISTHTDYVVFYIPAEGNLFEVQTNADLDAVPGTAVDLVATTGSVTTGISAHEVGASTNADFVVVEIPDQANNDPALTNANVIVQYTVAETAFK